MRHYDADPHDDDAREDWAEDVHHEALLQEYTDAKAALASLHAETDKTTRWQVLARMTQAAQALEAEQSRRSYDALVQQTVAACWRGAL